MFLIGFPLTDVGTCRRADGKSWHEQRQTGRSCATIPAMTHDDLPFSPAADRNKGPILDVLRRVLPASGAVLEIASGTGQHAAHFAANHPGWQWQPTDVDEAALTGIASRCASLPNVRPPIRLDVLALPWPPALGRFDAVYCANMLHISP